MKSVPKAFTLAELLVVLVILVILSAAALPLMCGKVDHAKWSEANTAAGMIRRAVKTYHAQYGTAPTGSLGNASTRDALDIEATDLTGSFFVPGDYEIVSVSAEGIAEVRVTGSLTKAPAGSRTLAIDGSWQ